MLLSYCYWRRGLQPAFSKTWIQGKTSTIVMHTPFTVIGVLKKQGAGLFGDSNDTRHLFRLIFFDEGW
jgi:hypothetical protein